MLDQKIFNKKSLSQFLKNSFSADVLLFSLYILLERRLPFELKTLFPRLKLSTLNTQTVFSLGNVCYGCGCVGHTVSVTLADSRYRLTFLSPSSGRVITADHVIPLSRGGSRGLINIQPLCNVCNQAKQNKQPEKVEEQLVYQRKKIAPLVLEKFEIPNGNKMPAYYHLCRELPGDEWKLLNLCKKMV